MMRLLGRIFGVPPDIKSQEQVWFYVHVTALYGVTALVTYRRGNG